ncbi:glutamate--tRNA ligase [Methylacidiphilum caldifontis]|uniref:Glutamate--tRNA ligase n=1 Tax=Methylacidiphilum caldifontis TaxID=2795386 RepID=A0A4Y8PB36_9BACT|nr:glutamate--tRNA ligase family protein [Methylacidiphilum caldifontis]QSR88161.1 glutamate--tRNA ligase [Methylacidiphilum caldifontis]TFE68200.1 glutamate--tRNA ligase [Methylacidiphilum caldifontis]
MNKMTPRVRFAPSPTGFLHVGGARTALFNWLYARHFEGTFILRIEDTDTSRNTPQALSVIFDNLKWLGLDWDEGPMPDGKTLGQFGPYFQSQRKEIYTDYCNRLIAQGFAYIKDEAVYFKMPRKRIIVPDIICGDIYFDCTLEKDFVIRRKDGSFVFHLVNVVDDAEMKISHVIRGEDHLSNTPKHIALFEALGMTPPLYAHIPLILNPGGTKMSKRDKGSSVQEYIDEGFLPKAFRNYLCLLGWSLKENREIFDIEEAIAKFDLPQIHRSNARFNYPKLLWINSEYMHSLPLDELYPHAFFWLEKAGLIDNNTDPSFLKKAIGIVREKVKTGKELVHWIKPLLTDSIEYEDEIFQQYLDDNGKKILAEVIPYLEKISSFESKELEETIKDLALKRGRKTADYIHRLRVALTGRTVGPSLYPMLAVLGKNRVLNRLYKVVFLKE